MHDTRRIQTGTRCHHLNNHSNLQLTTNWINHTETNSNTNPQPKSLEKVDNSNNDRKRNSDRFPRDEDRRLRYHWGADDTIMRIIKKRDNSLEIRELVERRIELAKPGNMRHHYNKRLKRQILVPRRPEEEERKEIKRIDLRLKRKEEH